VTESYEHHWWRPRPRLGEWADQAKCKGMGDLFFPEPIGPGRGKSGPLSNPVVLAAYAEAARVCAACPVFDECRAYAVALPKRDVQGMMAGLRPAQIHDLHRNRRRVA
jgi:hypothetical protein